jgi:uncharacterized protein (TIGR00251 family)
MHALINALPIHGLVNLLNHPMILQIKVKPNAKKALLEQQPDGSWLAWVNATPVDGKANARLIEIVAEHFGIRKSAVTIQSGTTSRLKRVRIDDQP